MICAARERDAYDAAVEYLTEHPKEIHRAWSGPEFNSGGCLFRFAARNADARPPLSNGYYGCLTMIRCSTIAATSVPCVAETESLTAAIQSDERIPWCEEDITPDHLPVFAEWQRELDRVLGRTPPAMENAHA